MATLPKKKEIKSTLEGFSDEYGRMSGNTTRQVDLGIQLLFKGFIVKVEDHHDNGKNRPANKELLNRILMRLKNEHSRTFYSKNINVNRDDLTIELYDTTRD